MRAYERIQEIQAGNPDAAYELAELAALADAKGWRSSRRVCTFGAAVHAWITHDDALADRIEDLVAVSRREDDDVLLAVGLSLRAALVPGEDGNVGSPETDRDVAEAIVLLEHASGDALDLITAHTACGIALYFRSLWELCDEQWAAAVSYEDHVGPGVGQTLLWAAAYDRLEAQSGWASNLRQLDDYEGLAERWDAWQRLLPEVDRFQAPRQWSTERDALSLLMAATCGSNVRSQAQRALGRLEADARDEPRAVMHLTLASALSAYASGDPGAAAEAERAVRAIDAEVFPDQYELALYLAAEIEAESGSGAGLRYARRQVTRRWDARLSRLGAVRSRILST